MTGTVEPGWYPDPNDDSLDRWWGGAGWTDRTRPAVRADELTAVRPAGAPAPLPPSAPGMTAHLAPVGPAPTGGAQPWPSSPAPPVGPPVVPPGPQPAPAPLPAASGRPGGVPLPALVGFVVGVIILAAAVILAVGLSGGDGGDSADAGPAPTTGSVPASTGPTTTTTVATTPSTVPAGPMVRLAPVSATASNERSPVQLKCGGRMAYGAEQLIDGDVDRGWGASSSDGTGQYVDVRFAQPVRLRRISITPGYLRLGQRVDQGCRTVSAFDFNRHVTQVRYSFDDGSSVVQSLPAVPEYQPIDVDTTTTTVRITILGTVRPAGADDDTVISEAVFEGST